MDLFWDFGDPYRRTMYYVPFDINKIHAYTKVYYIVLIFPLTLILI